MALSFNSASLNGSGSLVTQQLTSGTDYTFTIKNNGVATNNGYLTLEGNANANSNLSTTVTVTGSTTITGSASGSFVYTPSSTIPANSVYIKATGGVDVDINP